MRESMLPARHSTSRRWDFLALHLNQTTALGGTRLLMAASSGSAMALEITVLVGGKMNSGSEPTTKARGFEMP